MHYPFYIQESCILCQRDLTYSLEPILFGLQHLILNSNKADVPDVLVVLLRLLKQRLPVIVDTVLLFRRILFDWLELATLISRLKSSTASDGKLSQTKLHNRSSLTNKAFNSVMKFRYLFEFLSSNAAFMISSL